MPLTTTGPSSNPCSLHHAQTKDKLYQCLKHRMKKKALNLKAYPSPMKLFGPVAHTPPSLRHTSEMPEPLPPCTTESMDIQTQAKAPGTKTYQNTETASKNSSNMTKPYSIGGQSMKPNPNMTNGRQCASTFIRTPTSKSPGEFQHAYSSTKKIYMTVLKPSAQPWPQQMQGSEEASTDKSSITKSTHGSNKQQSTMKSVNSSENANGFICSETAILTSPWIDSQTSSKQWQYSSSSRSSEWTYPSQTAHGSKMLEHHTTEQTLRDPLSFQSNRSRMVTDQTTDLLTRDHLPLPNTNDLTMQNTTHTKIESQMTS